MQEHEIARNALRETIETLGITLQWEFVPWSKSRNADEKYKSLNWRCRLYVGARLALGPFDYSSGSAHAPANKLHKKFLLPYHASERIAREAAIAAECETGLPVIRATAYQDNGFLHSRKTIAPDVVDVVASLLLDAGAIDYGSFEDWATSYGYDSDSRKAELIYRACIDTGLALRNALGNTQFATMQELAAQI